LLTLEGNQKAIWNIHCEGDKIATGYSDGSIKVHHISTGELIFDLKGRGQKEDLIKMQKIRERESEKEKELENANMQRKTKKNLDQDLANGDNIEQLNGYPGLNNSVNNVNMNANFVLNPANPNVNTFLEDDDPKLKHRIRARDCSGKEFDLLNKEGHGDGIVCLKFDQAGQYLYSGSMDKTAKIWDMSNGNCIATLMGHKGPVTCIEISQEFIITGSDDGTIKVYSTKNRSCKFTLHGHLVGITALLLIVNNTPSNSSSNPNSLPSPSIGKLASGSQDGTIRLWDLNTGICKGIFSGHTNSITTLLFDISTFVLVSSSLDETIKVWDLSEVTQQQLLYHTHQGTLNQTQNQNQNQMPISGKAILSIESKGSTGVSLIESIIIGGGIGYLSLHSLSSRSEVRRIFFDDANQHDFDPAIIINKIVPHETGILFDYGENLKVFHFSEIAVKKKHS